MESNEVMLILLFLSFFRRGESGLCTCQHVSLSLWVCVRFLRVVTWKQAMCHPEVHPTPSLAVAWQPHQQKLAQMKLACIN